MLTIKFPKLQQHSNAQRAFINKESNQIIETSAESKILCITLFLSYVFFYSYMYASSIYKGKLSKYDFTLSSSFKYCEKKLSVILMFLTFGLIQGLLISKNFYIKDDYQRISVVVFNYVIITSWILLFFVFADTEHNSHVFIACIILFSTIFLSCLIYDSYSKYYKEEGLEGLKIMTIIISVIFILTILSAISFFGFKLNLGLQLLGIFEILCLFSYGIFIVIFSLLPALPNKDNITCYYNSS